MTRSLVAALTLTAIAALVVEGGDVGRAPRAGAGSTMVTEDVVTVAAFPVTLAFAPDGRLFYAEVCTGNVRIVRPDDTLLTDPFVNVGDVFCYQDYGFIGLALDPDFETNHYVYVQYMEELPGDPVVGRPVIKRFTDSGNVGVDPLTLLVGPETDPALPKFHGPDNIHFGPDGYLYASIGDLGKEATAAAQDLSTLEGKMLRLDKTDGSAPPDNPFVGTPGADPRIYAYGLRNSFDFTFQEETGTLYATENGPDRCDELNIIVAGGNYGWPLPFDSDTTCDVTGAVPAVYWFTFYLGYDPWLSNFTSAPTGVDYISGDVYPSLGESLLVCQWRNSEMRHLDLAAFDDIEDETILLTDCSLDVEINPATGAIYYTNAGAIRRILVDSDGDEVIDGADNCPAWPNAGQSSPPWTVPAGDPDCDGFPTDSEEYAGTLPLVQCPSTTDADDEDPDAWPVDFNDNAAVNIVDVLFFGPVISTSEGDPGYERRFDLNASGAINIVDVLFLGPYIGVSCTPG